MNLSQYAVQIILLILVYLTENIHQYLSIYQLKITVLNLLARISLLKINFVVFNNKFDFMWGKSFKNRLVKPHKAKGFGVLQ